MSRKERRMPEGNVSYLGFNFPLADQLPDSIFENHGAVERRNRIAFHHPPPKLRIIFWFATFEIIKLYQDSFSPLRDGRVKAARPLKI